MKYIILFILLINFNIEAKSFRKISNDENLEITTAELRIDAIESIKKFDRFLEKEHSITNSTENENIERLLSLLHSYKINANDKNVQFYNYAINELERARISNNENNKISALSTSKKIFYSMYVEEPVLLKTLEETLKFRLRQIGYTSSMMVTSAKNMLFQSWENTIPYIDDDHINRPLEESAILESNNLEIPISKLGSLNAEQVANLDILESNPLWFTNEIAAKESKNRLVKIEKWYEAISNKILKNKNKPANFSLENAKKVMLFDQIKDSATSPKIEAKDLYGFKWKVKWGEEVETEPVGTRLYLKLGGKFITPVYAMGSDTVTMILEKDKNKIDTLKKLKISFIKSKYNFNIEPYIPVESI